MSNSLKELPSKRLRINDALSATVFSPENPSVAIPLIVAPGWGETESTLELFARMAVQSGRVVVTYDNLAKPAYPQEAKTELEKKALTLSLVIEAIDSTIVDIFTHSAASADAAVAISLLSTTKVSHLFLCNPVGLIGDDSRISLFGRFVKKNAENITRTAVDPTLRKRVMGGLAQAVSYVVHKPMAALKEIGEIAHTTLENQLAHLHKQGVKIIIIHSVDDSGFPMERMQHQLSSTDNPQGFVDGFYSLTGGHDLIFLHPEELVTILKQIETASTD